MPDDGRGDSHWMRRAIHLSRRLAGRTHPNPAVGCVIARENVCLGEGFHEGPGRPHAEVMALQAAAGHDLRDATCYVTLEPCNHTGRTPPCTEALIAAGIRRVVIAIRDPNPHVTGGGIERLREAGIEVITGVLAAPAMDVLESWLTWVRTGYPFTTVKMAMSLDGHTATWSGDSRWISGPASRSRVHRLRERVAGIMVGAGTIRCDDPALTARRDDRVVRAPVRVIVDRAADAPSGAQVFRPDSPGRTIWVVPETEVETARRRVPESVVILPCAVCGNGLDLDRMMYTLGSAFDLESILVEGGPTLAFSLVEQKLVHKIMMFIAPVLIGGSRAPSALGGAGFERMSQAVRLSRHRIRKIGEDVLIEGWLDEGIPSALLQDKG